MKQDIWIFLFIMGLLLFSWPLITIFRGNLSSYLFIVWGLFIVLLFLASTFSDRRDGGR
jgi:hypothetical protein